MNFCTNCGAESKGKTCAACGMKKNKTHNHCGWCGAALEGAKKCPACGEKVKSGLIWKILSIVAAVFIGFLMIAPLSEGEYGATLLLLVALLLTLPFVKTLILKWTHGKKALRTLLIVARILAVLILFAVGLAAGDVEAPEPPPVDTTVEEKTPVEADAVEAALEIFHKEIRLKNEASFVLNEYEYEYSDTIGMVTIVLDYSAQNGFGGMNRETVKVIFDFDKETGTFNTTDQYQINTDDGPIYR